MNIYLFAKEKLNLLKDIIRIGDFCLLYDKEALFLWIQDECSLKDNADLNIKYAQVCSNVQIICPPNPLIFSYNGVEKRTGNRKDLKSLIDSVSNHLLQDVLKNALDVLEYREDRMDILPLSLLFEQIQKQMEPLPFNIIKEEKKVVAVNPVKEKTEPVATTPVKPLEPTTKKVSATKEIYPPEAYYFYDYLGKREQKYWQSHYLDDISTHSIFREIRKINKDRYREFFNRFLKEHPDLNIYSKKDNIPPRIIAPKSEEGIEVTSIQALYLLLTQNGYAQMDNGIWKTPNGQYLNILVEETSECIPNDEVEVFDTTTEKEEEVVNKDILKCIFQHVSTTYKYFWFLSILTISLKKNSRSIPYQELVARMISLAYPYTEKRISFGNIDKMHDIIQSLVLTRTLDPFKPFAENEKQIIKQFDDERVHRILNQLLLNVPYRFLSPWIPFTNNKEVIAKSQDPRYKAPYTICPDHIEMNKDWQDYFRKNYEKIFKSTKSELTDYLLHFNEDFQINRLKF